MARTILNSSLLNTGAAANDGTGLKHRAGGLVIKQWIDQIDSMMGDLYQATPAGGGYFNVAQACKFDGSIETEAIQSVIRAAGANSTVLFPDVGASYKTGPLYVNAGSGISLIGTGRRGSQILFYPTGNRSETIGSTYDPGTCFQIANASGASLASQCMIKDISISSSDLTYDKCGVRPVEVSQFFMQNVSINGMWGGPVGSVCLQTKGHEIIAINECYFNGSVPVRISKGPMSTGSPPSISSDHFHFSNNYLLGATISTQGAVSGPANNLSILPSCNFLIDDQVRIVNLLIDGYQAWVGGNDGLNWVAATNPGDSQAIVKICNVRKEGAYGTGHNAMFRIDLTSNTKPLENLIIENCGTGEGHTSLAYLRNVKNAIVTGGGFIANHAALSAGDYVVDMQTGVESLDVRGVAFPTGATFNLSGFADNSASVTGGRIKAGWTWPTTATWVK